jgi:hypothetical protein
MLGVVERAWLVGNGHREGSARVRFSKRPEVDGVLTDVKDGILRRVSPGRRPRGRPGRYWRRGSTTGRPEQGHGRNGSRRSLPVTGPRNGRLRSCCTPTR